MKKILSIITVLLSVSAIAQKNITPPAATKAAFEKSYPAVNKVKWEKEDGNYEAGFVLNGIEMSVIYTGKGEMLESEVEMKASDLPAAVTAYMKEHYKGITVKGGAKITKANGTVNYEAAIKGKDVLFDANGKFIKEAKD